MAYDLTQQARELAAVYELTFPQRGGKLEVELHHKLRQMSWISEETGSGEGILDVLKSWDGSVAVARAILESCDILEPKAIDRIIRQYEISKVSQ